MPRKKSRIPAPSAPHYPRHVGKTREERDVYLDNVKRDPGEGSTLETASVPRAIGATATSEHHGEELAAETGDRHQLTPPVQPQQRKGWTGAVKTISCVITVVVSLVGLGIYIACFTNRMDNTDKRVGELVADLKKTTEDVQLLRERAAKLEAQALSGKEAIDKIGQLRVDLEKFVMQLSEVKKTAGATTESLNQAIKDLKELQGKVEDLSKASK